MSQEVLTLSVEEAGKLLGISRGTAFKLVREHRFPTPVLRLGKKIRVSRPALEKLLGAESSREVSDR